jgi:hypothetical protein
VIAAGGYDPALGPLDNAMVAFALDGQSLLHRFVSATLSALLGEAR